MVPAVSVHLSVTSVVGLAILTGTDLYGNKPRAEGVERSVTLAQFSLRTKPYYRQKVHSCRVTNCSGAPCQSDLQARPRIRLYWDVLVCVAVTCTHCIAMERQYGLILGRDGTIRTELFS